MHKVAVIGSGPAGFMCATKLKDSGFDVIIYDELKEFGGMLAYGLPEFRVPMINVKERIEQAKKSGVKFEMRKIIQIKQLLKVNGGEFDFVVLAIGGGPGAKTGFEGEDSNIIIDALKFLAAAKLDNKKMLTENDVVAVIGGGNSAVDAARTAVRQGADVTVIYRRTENEMPAFKKEIEEAKNEGVKFDFLKAPKKCHIEGDGHVLVCSQMQLGAQDSSGRRAPVDSGETIKLAFTKIILATGQQIDYAWLENEGIKTNKKIILVDDSNKTSLENVYACGDCVTGPRNIGEAIISGMKTATSIINSVKNKS
jgi:NADPH-dependent glutamate synthase beta subunit-like oxidoreductase